MQQSMAHQMMGYDRTSTMFSPDGRLLQVEYAKKTVKQGTSALGIACKDGVVLMADKRIVDPLVVPKSIEKIYHVDDHIGATASGILSDGRILIEKAQLIAQQHKVTYDSPIDVSMLTKEICDMKQAFTQYGGARPFGVSILFAGVNGTEAQLFATEPTGIYFEFKATAIGEAEQELKDILAKEYKDNMSVDEGIKLAVRSLKKVLGKEFDINRLEGAYIKTSDKQFTRLKKEDIKA
ncbi:MAG: archaeal proteasome endopeptidase complex subunit alpha [Candidatus Woesearchaeota archaeon]|nr:MAG: archaeal proteasome endopeptidase complex subunit alpha [Candidatus Woesearchaeota archaeon]